MKPTYYAITLSVIAAIGLLPTGCAPFSSGNQVSASDIEKRQQTMSSSDHLIVPGQRVGPIRLGMGMDEVANLLGQPDYSGLVFGGGSAWTYSSLNLKIFFSNAAAPSVTTISYTCWAHAGDGTNGGTYWPNLDPPTILFQTSNGIGLGSTSFDVKRAYSFSSYHDETLSMNYSGLGLDVFVTNDQYHKIYEIRISSPQ
jgi:hypothetical protein